MVGEKEETKDGGLKNMKSIKRLAALNPALLEK